MQRVLKHVHRPEKESEPVVPISVSGVGSRIRSIGHANTILSGEKADVHNPCLTNVAVFERRESHHFHMVHVGREEVENSLEHIEVA